MITRAITTDRRFVHSFDERRPNQSKSTEKFIAQKSQPNLSASFQSETQTIPVVSAP